MYANHFKLRSLPFSLTPNTEFFCELPTHQEAMNVLMYSLQQGEGFIKIIGEVGTGKTLLCRLLLNKLGDDFVTAYIPNPERSGYGLLLALAQELGIVIEGSISQNKLNDLITQKLLAIHAAGKHAVLIIDEAQALPEDCLETVRLLTNLETEQHKLLQVVLFGQPELDNKLNSNGLRQLKQRIVFSYQLRPLNLHELDIYLCHRLATAGHTYGKLFSPSAKKRLYRASGGLPRLLNVLCHKALLIAFGRGLNQVDTKSVLKAIADTESVATKPKTKSKTNLIIMAACALYVAVIGALYWKLGMS